MAFGRVLCFSRLDAAKRSLTIYQAEIKKEFKNKKTRVLETLQARNKKLLMLESERTKTKNEII